MLAKELYYSGNTVIVDHGIGVFTIYMHMSELKVKAGDAVVQGQVIGKSGMTGRVSGPHLHWGAIIYDEKVDPLKLIEAGKS